MGLNESNWDIGLYHFLSLEEVYKIKIMLKVQREKKPMKRSGWIDWFIVELGLSTGLRVFEMCNLICGDIVDKGVLSFVQVRKGKGGKSRQVRIAKSFLNSFYEFLSFKENTNEDINPKSWLLISPKTKRKYSTRGLQQSFKRSLKIVTDISQSHSIHDLRHTYASLLLKSSKNSVVLVQKQLGHSSLSTTMAYMHLFEKDVVSALEGLV